MATFDYIIIGAGSAGCVLANRLSADPQNKILLLEAGPQDRNRNISIPAAFSKIFRSDIDWNYNTVPQKHAANRVMFQPRGKVLGGCSSINAMIYIRGHKKDYDHWSALGNKGWSYKEILSLFKKSENYINGSNAYHGDQGELSVENHRTVNPLTVAFIKAAKEAGYGLNKDFNGAQQEGFGLYHLTQTNGERCSAATAFLKPAKSRSNLSIITNAVVHQIIIEDGIAKSVSYEHRGQMVKAASQSEIIVCAGTFNTPQLLLLSGIGDETQLQKHGISVVKHLPGVGKNLLDHLVCGFAYNCTQNITLDRIEDFPYVVKNLLYYLMFKKGPFTSNVAEAGGFLRTSKTLEAPDLQFHFGPAYFIEHGFRNPQKGNGFSLGATLIQPKSKGEVRLASSDPTQKIQIDPQYYSDQNDMVIMMKGMKICQSILDQIPFHPYRLSRHLPAEAFRSEEECIQFVKDNSETLYHPVGTCKMGKDIMAVVDDELKVHGIVGLRVADASIMPTIPRGNTNAPTIMIAEKAAEMILQKKISLSTVMSNQ